MKNVRIIAPVVAAAFGAALLAGASVHAAELKIATFMPPNHHLNAVVFTNLAKNIESATGGSIKMKLFPSGQLGKGPVQQYKRVVDNVSEVAFGIHGYTSSIFPRTMVVAQPGVGTTAVEITKKLWSVYDEYLKPEYSKVKLLGLWANTPPVLISRNKPIHSIDDIKGLKVRALDATNIPQVNSWGASGLHIPISGVYDALDKGVIDVVYVAVNALIPPWRFGEIAKHVSDGINSPSANFWLAINKGAWDGLSGSEKAAIDKLTGLDFSVATARSWAQPDTETLDKLKKGEMKGVTYYTLSKAEAAKFDAATEASVEKYLADAEASGVPARAIYAAVTKPSM